MTPLLITAVAIVAALVLVAVTGRLLNRRSGVLREDSQAPEVDTSDLGLSTTGPTIVHFRTDFASSNMPAGHLKMVI